MIIDSETKRKLREMNAAELLDAFERLDERTVMPLNHAEVVGLAVDNAYGGYTPTRRSNAWSNGRDCAIRRPTCAPSTSPRSAGSTAACSPDSTPATTSDSV